MTYSMRLTILRNGGVVSSHLRWNNKYRDHKFLIK